MPFKPVQIIAGLGNPGLRYDDTRHNAGFWFVDRVAARHGGTFRANARFQGEICETEIEGRRVRLLKPRTMMNLSGNAIAALAGFYRHESNEILVVHDEIDLPPGTVRLKDGGGHGGHNGLRDVIPKLGARDFLRLRIGVGHPGNANQVVGYVLQRASRGDQALIDDAIERALDHVGAIVAGNAQQAMNELHRKSESVPPE